MPDYYTPKGKHLTMADRRLIERWKQEGKSNREIAGLLGKAPQTINNEIKQGLVLQQVRQGKFEKVYRADRAQDVYETNRKNSRKPISLTKEEVEKTYRLPDQPESPQIDFVSIGQGFCLILLLTYATYLTTYYPKIRLFEPTANSL